MDKYSKWFYDRGLSKGRFGFDGDAENAGDIAQDLGIRFSDKEALEWVLKNFRSGDSNWGRSFDRYQNLYEKWNNKRIEDERDRRNDRDDRDRRDDRDDRDDRYDRPVPGDPSRFWSVSEGEEWEKYGIPESIDDNLSDAGFTAKEAARQINYAMEKYGFEDAEEAGRWVLNNSRPGASFDTIDDRFKKSDPKGLATKKKQNDLMNEFLDYYREDREEAKDWRDKLDEERKEALDKALEEERRRKKIEDEARQEFISYREKTRGQYEDEMTQREKFRDLAQQSYQDRADLMQEIKNAPSTVEESLRQSFEQSLSNQAALAATLPTRTGGSSAKMLADQARTHNAQIAAQGAVSRMVEQQAKNQMLSGLIGQQEASATQQQQFALGGAQSALAAQNQAMQEMSAQGAMAQRALGAQGLQHNVQNTLGGQYGANLSNIMQGGSGYAGAATNLIGQQYQMQLQREQMDMQRLNQWLGLASAGLAATGTIAGAAFGGPAGAAVGGALGGAAGQAIQSAGQSNYPSGNIA